MAFERPLTIMEALAEIDKNHYALPALQREFVWSPSQICTLFDSVMKGYPIGSFLFWKLEPQTARDFKFYRFMRDYHQRNNPYCEEFPVQTQGPKVAVLDGQQRLTAFNIALFGSYALKKKYARHDSARSYPLKRLYLNLLKDPMEQREPGDALTERQDHDFQFLTQKEAERRDAQACWFLVADVRAMSDPYECMEHVMGLGLDPQPARRATLVLSRLHKVLNTPLVSYYMEQDQDLDKVLTVFIRINSGGTKLSYADLLLSIATTQWESIDARKAINDLVETMNHYGAEQHFTFNKDFVLKAGLVLTRRPNVKFTAANFTAENMQRIEQEWPRIVEALHLTAQLLQDYGFGRRHMRATSSAIVIAYYLYHRGYDQSFLERAAHADERAEIRRWLVQMSLSGIWGGSFADIFLPRIPEHFDEQGTFSAQALFALTRRLGRDPYLDSDAIEQLLETTYNDKNAYLLLSLVFDSIQAHTARAQVDHIYPRALMRAKKLEKLGLSQEEAQRLEERANTLPNLWLLSKTTNQEKGAKLPLDWLDSLDQSTRDYFISFHHLQELQERAQDFDVFYEARRARLRPLLQRAFGRPVAASSAEPGAQQTQQLKQDPPPELHGTLWSEDTLAILEERYHPLAQVLMAAGLPEPDDVDREIVRDGLTTSHRSIMHWSMASSPVLLLAPGTPHAEVDAAVVVVSEDVEAMIACLRTQLGAQGVACL